jgi:cob(I)alamin adenosyltransferase
MAHGEEKRREPSLVGGKPTEGAQRTGFVHVYYGGGKGKTTAAIGLAVRAAGAGKRVLLVQFDKGFDKDRGEHYSERRVLRAIPEIDLRPTGMERIRADGTFRFGVEPDDLAEARRGLAEAKAGIESLRYDLVILDEALGALAYGLLDEKDILAILDAHEASGRHAELVLTGHKLTDAIKERADLVTRMEKVKHYFDKGVPARVGIEI